MQRNHSNIPPTRNKAGDESELNSAGENGSALMGTIQSSGGHPDSVNAPLLPVPHTLLPLISVHLFEYYVGCYLLTQSHDSEHV